MKSRLLSLLLLLITLLSLIGLLACYGNAGVLSIESAADLATIGGSVAAVVSLAFIARQLNQQAQLTRASNSLSFVNLSSDFTTNVVNDDDLIRIWYSGGAYTTLTPIEQFKYKQLMDWWLTLYDNVLYQHNCDLLDAAVFNAWDADMDRFVVNRGLTNVWADLQGGYGDEFVRYVDNKIARLLGSPPGGVGSPP